MADRDNTTTSTYEYKIRPNRAFIEACERELEHHRQIYNAALQERIGAYKTGVSLGLYDQSQHLTDARKLPEVKAHLRTIQTDALNRLDEAFQAFFKRAKKGGGKAGFPRFKGKHRYHTFSQTIEPQRGCPINGDKLNVPGVGTCRVRLSRPLPEGAKVRQIRITRRADGWFALLVITYPKPAPLTSTGQSVGIDVGIKSFATLSNGKEIENPRHLNKAHDQLVKEQRRLSRKKKGSANRRKARAKVARRHLKVSRARKDFHHKVTAWLIASFDLIVLEQLNIRGMVKNHHLARAILDVAWGNFLLILEAKAEKAGRRVERVSARYTSMTCSECQHRQKMPLKVRTFICEACGFVCDRDHNAAVNIKLRASSPKVTPVETPVTASVKQERSRSRNDETLKKGFRVTTARTRS